MDSMIKWFFKKLRFREIWSARSLKPGCPENNLGPFFYKTKDQLGTDADVRLCIMLTWVNWYF